MNEATRLANLALETQGYLCVRSTDGWIGKVLPNLYFSRIDDTASGPLIFVGMSSREEMDAQMRLFGLEIGEYDPRYEYFRAVAE